MRVAFARIHICPHLPANSYFRMRKTLTAGTERRLGEAFTSALVLAGCGAQLESPERFATGATTPVASESPPPLTAGNGEACPGLSIAGISVPERLDGIEIRTVHGSGASPGERLRLAGSACSTADCEREVVALDARFKGWDLSIQLETYGYVVGYRGGSVVGSATNEGELVALIGTLDTPTEVELLATLKGFDCLRIQPTAAGFEATVSQMTSSCPVTHQEVRYEVLPDGRLRELARGAKTESGVCIGRKPEGLLARAGDESSTLVGTHLARAAELEAASVVAFLTLKGELEAHGAPRRLVRRVIAAARDEVRHARTMTALALRFGGRPEPRRIRLEPVRSLEAMARENLNEGCVTETWGALVGRHQAASARLPAIRRAFSGIARDELRHAALSWDLQSWFAGRLSQGASRGIGEGGRDQLAALGASLDAAEFTEADRELGLPAPSVARFLFGILEQRLWSEAIAS
jgi:hypothetical protein